MSSLNLTLLDEYGNTIYNLTQWDINQKLIVEDIQLSKAPVIHFCNKKSKKSLVVPSAIEDGKIIADIPNVLLTEPLTIVAYLFLSENNSGKTVEIATIPVRNKPKPDDYEYSDNVEVVLLGELIQEVKDLINDTDEFLNKKADKNNTVLTGTISHGRRPNNDQNEFPTGENSVSFGVNNVASGLNSFVSGASNIVSSNCGDGGGFINRVHGDFAVARGAGNWAWGHRSDVGNEYNAAEPGADNAFVRGKENKAISPEQAVFGRFNKLTNDALFLLGNGTENNKRSNIVEMYDDKIVVHGDIYEGDKSLEDKYGNSVAEKLKTPRSIDGVNFDGTANAMHYALCSTPGATVTKAVTIANFTLITGARVTIKFANTNTATNATLNVSSTGYKPIYYKGSAVPVNYITANTVITLQYDGSYWNVVGELTDAKVQGQITSINNLISSLETGGGESTFDIKYVVCDTEADVQRKTLYLDGDIGADGDIILVNFAKGIDVENPSLYIPGFGEYPTQYKDGSIPSGSVESGMIVMFRFNNTDNRWYVVNALQTPADSDTSINGFELYGQLSDIGLTGSHSVQQVISAMSQKSIFMTHLTQSGITGLGDMTGYENGFIRITKAQGYGSAQIVEIYGKTKYKWKDASNMDNPWNEVEYPIGVGEGIPYVMCMTPAGTKTKTITMPNLTIKEGVRISIMFYYGISVDSPVLNVNNTGEIGILYKGKALPSGIVTNAQIVDFVFNDGWHVAGSINETGNYFGICTTAIDVATKEVSIDGITSLRDGLIITVMFENGISADGTIGKLYVNGIQDGGYCYVQTHLRNNATAERRTLNFVYRGGTWFSIG